jgi:hypothetical protein
MDKARAALLQYPTDFTMAYPVSTRANSPKIHDERPIKRFVPRADMP